MSSILFYSTRKSKFFLKKLKIHTQKKWTEWHFNVFLKKSHNAEKLKGDPLRFFNIHSVAKHEKIEENKKFYFREKISQCRKKLKTLWDFSTSILSKTSKRCRGNPLGKFFFSKKSLAVPKKNERGDPLVSLGTVCDAEKPFWFSSLGQIVQFGAIIFCRTFKNYFGQFVWIEKKSL